MRAPFYFLRHGETDYNREGRFQGRIDVPLNATGLVQAEAAAHRLADAGITRIVSSPALRALRTATAVAELTGLPIYIERNIIEFNVGSFEGQLIAPIREKFALQGGHDFLRALPSDAESWPDFSARVHDAVVRWHARHGDETMLFVSHGLVFRALTDRICGLPVSSPNAAPQRFVRIEDRWVVEAL